MERDKLVGLGHWRGYHTVADISGDSSSHDQTQRCTGGLKMGATYWYYYLLDNGVEYYNQAEPVTTKCFLLPGQPVNILKVPIILPDSRLHGRSASDGLENLNYRTMNPEEKFMYPRKPPKPILTNLQTARTKVQQISPSYPIINLLGVSVHPSSSQPSSATTREFHSKDARSVSPPRSRGCPPSSNKRRELSPRLNVFKAGVQKETAISDIHDIPGARINISTASALCSSQLDNSLPASIQSRRALRTNGRDVPESRNLLMVETRPQHRRPSVSKAAAASSNLGTVDESSALKDVLNFGTHQVFDEPTTSTSPDMKEKRLPTLPNTPSSVMEEAVRAIDERDRALDLDVLRSHFSSLTTMAESNHSASIAERSRFSEWSTDAEDDSPTSIVCPSEFQQSNDSPSLDGWRTPELSQAPDATTDTDPNTPRLTIHSKPSSPSFASDDVLPWGFQLAASPLSPLERAGLGFEQADEVESNPKRHAALFNAMVSVEEFSLSQNSNSNSSPILLPHMQRGLDTRVSNPKDQAYGLRLSDVSFHSDSTMRELMDELSYLKDMIHVQLDGEPF